MELAGWRVVLTAVLGLGIIVAALTAAHSQPAGAGSPAAPAISDTLPPTNFSAADVDRSALPRAAPGFARATVASNPQAPDAHAVGEKTCIACHKLEADHFTKRKGPRFSA